MNTLKSLGQAFKVPEIRKKIIFTVLMLIVFRLGCCIPVPGIDRNVLSDYFSSASGLFGLFDMFSGGSFSNFTIFALSITPYVTASIILQLLTVAIPRLEALSKEGTEGRKKIAQYTRYLTVVLAFVQSIGLTFGLFRSAVIDNSFFSLMVIVLTLTAGTAFLMWLGEQINEYGIGNGISLIIMAGITFAMMFMGGTNLFYLVGGAGVGALGLFGLAMTKGHSSSRILVWKDPFAYLLNGGWQPAQSLYAIGSGGFWGVGFGNSRQKHLYLPEPQNDYIFSIWCEEMGFIGAMLVICIFLFFIYRGILIGLRAPDRFSSLLVIGIIMHVGLQMVLNIAVVTNSLPSTGISLPFFSYGGTSLMILLAEMGVVLSVSRFSSVEKS